MDLTKSGRTEPLDRLRSFVNDYSRNIRADQSHCWAGCRTRRELGFATFQVALARRGDSRVRGVVAGSRSAGNSRKSSWRQRAHEFTRQSQPSAFLNRFESVDADNPGVLHYKMRPARGALICTVVVDKAAQTVERFVSRLRQVIELTRQAALHRVQCAARLVQ